MQTLILILIVLVAVNLVLSLLLLRRYRLLNHWTSWIAQDYTDLNIYIQTTLSKQHNSRRNSSKNRGKNGNIKQDIL